MKGNATLAHPSQHATTTGKMAPPRSAGNATSKFLPFNQALLYARSLKLASSKGWRVWRKSDMRPANIPAYPDTFYMHDGWQGYGHWLGSSNLRTKVFLPFKKALKYARSLKLKSKAEW